MCWHYRTAQEAIVQIPLLNPDVVLIDINLGSEETGIDCVKALKQIVPATNFMMCTVYEENEKIFRGLTVGVSDSILKITGPAWIPEVNSGTISRGVLLSSQIARKVAAAFQNKPIHSCHADDLDILSHREKEIPEQLSKGLMYKEIAAELFICPETDRKQVYRI